MAQEIPGSCGGFEYGTNDPRYRTHRVVIKRTVTNRFYIDMFKWLREDAQEGHFHTYLGDMSYNRVFLFDNENTAFNFRLRFG